jgi:hypothetical protein
MYYIQVSLMGTKNEENRILYIKFRLGDRLLEFIGFI